MLFSKSNIFAVVVEMACIMQVGLSGFACFPENCNPREIKV